MGVVQDMKDGALALALRAFLNERFKDYGEIQDCQVDTASSHLSLRALLRGEAQAVSASIERYELVREGKDIYVVLHELSASREWLTRLLQVLLAGKRYKITPAIAALL